MSTSRAIRTEAALYVVATPIGNLGDMTPRAVEVLKSVDLIAAEDTRHSGRLLQHFGIGTHAVSYHDFSTSDRVSELIRRLKSGSSIALISDAGTPLISDPGYRLVHQAREESIPVVPVPGVSAVTAALSVAGLPSDRFAFEGFLPNRQSARLKQLQELSDEGRTLIFYESSHRVLDCLRDMEKIFGSGRRIVVSRELTKTFETVHSAALGDAIDWMSADGNRQRGEFVLVVRGAEKPDSGILTVETERILDLLLLELPVSQAASLVARITGVKKKVIYQRALEKKTSG